MEFKTINKYLENLVNALREENEANTEMLDNFYTYLETDDKKYLKLANNQLREILKGAGFGILLSPTFFTNNYSISTQKSTKARY